MRIVHGRQSAAVTVRDLMSRTLAAVDPRESLVEAAAEMRARRVGSLAVLDGQEVVGIITERDLLRALADELPPAETHVSEYMTQSPLTVDAGQPAAEAARLMLAHRVRHLLVTEHGRLAGCVSVRDLLRLQVWPQRRLTEVW